MKFNILENHDEVIKLASTRIKTDILDNPYLALGLATGETMKGLYKHLVKSFNNDKMDFSHIRTLNLDEYCGLESDNKNSYRYYMNEHLYSKTNIKESNIGFPQESSCKKDSDFLLDNPLDVQLLGIGSNGHIAFNEPNSSFDSITRVVKLNDSTRIANSRFFNSVDEVPTHAVTLGIKNIMSAKKIILIATGEKKADAIYKALKGPINESIPASILQMHPNIEVIIDEEAGKYMKGSPHYDEKNF